MDCIGWKGYSFVEMPMNIKVRLLAIIMFVMAFTITNNL